MDPFLYSALSRLASVSTSALAGLLDRKDLLARLRSGQRPDGLHPSLSKALAKLDWARAEKEDRAAQKAGMVILCWEDPQYPARLREIPDPPPALFLKGDPAALETPSLGIVGSRLCTVYGLNVARTLASDLALAGFAVTSGLARGIDSAAHEGSLSAPGRAVAVLGTGADVIYPKENETLARKILDKGGAVLSEFPPGTPPMPRNFPIRNRVIAGLTLGILVVEATERSGSLITARFALETGREVFAVPHNITSRTGVGPNTLIQKGAKLVQRAQDVFEELPAEICCNLKPFSPGGESSQAFTEGSPAAARLLAVLKPDEGAGVDALCRASGLTAAQVMAALLELQMGDRCVELPGMRYALKAAQKESL